MIETMTKETRVEKMRELGKLFIKLHIDKPEARVNMVETNFNVCGTVACHAGWYAVANGISIDYDKDYDFESSANEMAEFLGFSDQTSLAVWAGDKSIIWGNNSGSEMFYGAEAFGENESKLTLNVIGKHWLGVADRLEQS